MFVRYVGNYTSMCDLLQKRQTLCFLKKYKGQLDQIENHSI